MLDAIVIGAGPSGLGASIALSGHLPHYTPACIVEDPRLEARLGALIASKSDGLIQAADLPLLSSGLRGRSNNPLALFFDALQHPGVDTGYAAPSCLELRLDANAALSHLVVDPLPPGGSWHGMHDATKTLSPGPWMEFPGFPLARFLADHAALQPEAAVTAALQLQPRSTIAEYYRAAAEHFGVTKSYRPWRVESVVRTPAASSSSGGSSQPPTWTVTFADSVSPPLRARALVLATGTYSRPRRLGVPGEELGFVSHRCKDLAAGSRAAREQTLAPASSLPTVLVVGAGLSAADCVVHLLRTTGAHVIHAFRGAPDATKVGSKFGSAAAARMYPEYVALVAAMRGSADDGAEDRTAGASSGHGGEIKARALLGGHYTPLPYAQLRQIHSDGTCELAATTPQSDATTPTLSTHKVDEVAVLIGSTPDWSFLPPDVTDALARAGEAPSVSAEGVEATHPVFVDVDPMSLEARAVPGMFALGPLRGDNFARFAMHDGHGVAEALRARIATEHSEQERNEAPPSCDGSETP